MRRGARRRSGPVLLGLLLGLAVGLSGCASQPATVSPPVDPTAAFAEAGTTAVPDRWWTAFDNEDLNAVVDSATTANFGLRTAWQRLKAAQAVVDRESGALFPDLEGSAQARATRGQTTDREGANAESFSLGLSSAYEIDVWGRIRARVQADRLRAEATRAEYQTAALSLSAEVVRTWVQLAEAQSQLQLVEQQIETNEKVLRLLENRFETGQIRSVDILRQRQLVESTREQRAMAKARVQVLEHRLAVLLGRPPQAELDVTPDSLPDLPPLPKTGVPTDLIRRRPDVQRAHNLLRAADRDLAAAISDQFPRLTLSASVFTDAGTVDNLFQNWAYAFAGNLLAPIFRGGELRAEVKRSAAVRKQRLYEYGRTVLTAFRDVENALIREKTQRKRIERIEKQVDLGRRAYEQLRLQYLNGAANYLDVVTALDELQQLRRDRLAAELALVEDRIALYRALAGSFETDRERED